MAQPANKRRKTITTSGSTITDPRFANIQSDPRYRLPGKKQKIKLDKRFSRALQDEDFSRKAKVDRYGRPLETKTETQRLKRKYEFAEEDDEDSDEADDDEEVQEELKRVEEARDILRQGKDISSSEDESSSDEDSEPEDQITEQAGPGVQKAEIPLGEVSSRLAVVNLDWDNIRAEDLMAVFNSFLPPAGRLLKVAVYPSEFGRERMEREEMEGPPKEIFASMQSENVNEMSDLEDDEDNIKESIIKPDDGSEFDSTALRQYQLDRLRYFYAVLTFSSVETAKAIYDAVDGTEYLSTANFFDLRFVPDDTEFDNDKPREECQQIPVGYKPNEFVTDALQHSKVKLTWDADDGSRKEAQARAFGGSRNDIDENDLKAYLGSDSDDESEQESDEDMGKTNLSKKEVERQRMRALLGLTAEPVKPSKKEKDGPTGNIQITFSAGLSGAVDTASDPEDDKSTAGKGSKPKRSVFANSPEPEETTMEKYIRKEKERKQRRKEKTKGSGGTADTTLDDNADQADHEISQGFDDPFFAEADPAASQSASKLRKEERLKRRREREEEEAANAASRAQLELLMADDTIQDSATNHNEKPSAKGRTVRHFDMKEIEKAEKAASKSSKHKKHKNKSSSSTLDATTQDNFEMQTADPRFARVFENHEFAIDPTNPRFKGTKGMQALLEEGRKRKDKTGMHTAGGDKSSVRKESDGSKVKPGERAGGQEVNQLIEKIKRKNKSETTT